MPDGFLIHYNEIALKRGNRPFFVSKLAENIKNKLNDFGAKSVQKIPGRLFLDFNELEVNSLLEVKEALACIPGIANFMPVFAALADMEELKKKIIQEIKNYKFASFKIDTKRGDKNFRLNSEEINCEIGTLVQKETGAKVDLGKPEFTVFIEVLHKEIFFGFEKIKGVGGLPVGTGGRVAVLLSGGIDSPVASFMMIKRGCEAIFLHFHAYPYLDYSSQEKVKELSELLGRYQNGFKLCLIPFGDIQKQVVLRVPEEYRVIIYRRLMLKIAERIAKKEKAAALVTGDSLGQVASQTLDNIAAINSAISLPVFRPLIGMDKEEIINTAKNIGTYDVSIMPDQDCCQLFMPRHPATKSSIADINKIESNLDFEEISKLKYDVVVN